PDSMHRRNEMAANFLIDESVTEAMIEISDYPQHAATEALALSQDPLIKEEAAFAFALSGDCSRSEPLATELSHQFPFSTMMQNYNVPMIRAACAMHSDPARAARMLDVAQPYELGGIFDWNMQVVYVRGLAYLKAHEGKLAAIEFQKLIDHPGIVLIGVQGPLAHLQLARAQVMMGDNNAARKSYQDFLTLWKDADPDIPIYRQAKAEYARLQVQ
ncbi:MAG TPA: hypothetical protein VLW48_01365, partial [Candidatus Bathyarchaeia archaeon]|nr:hypothetical protein [Candidatus Bathyarchaeia archaeon]